MSNVGQKTQGYFISVAVRVRGNCRGALKSRTSGESSAQYIDELFVSWRAGGTVLSGLLHQRMKEQLGSLCGKQVPSLHFQLPSSTSLQVGPPPWQICLRRHWEPSYWRSYTSRSPNAAATTKRPSRLAFRLSIHRELCLEKEPHTS